MQLSLPVPFPVAAETPVSPGLTMPAGATPSTTETKGDVLSFEQLLASDEPPELPAAPPKSAPDGEQAAMLLAAVFCPPPAPPPPPVMVATSENPAGTLTDGTELTGEHHRPAKGMPRPTASGGSMFFAAQNARAYSPARSMEPLTGREATATTDLTETTEASPLVPTSTNIGQAEQTTAMPSLPAVTDPRSARVGAQPSTLPNQTGTEAEAESETTEPMTGATTEMPSRTQDSDRAFADVLPRSTIEEAGARMLDPTRPARFVVPRREIAPMTFADHDASEVESSDSTAETSALPRLLAQTGSKAEGVSDPRALFASPSSPAQAGVEKIAAGRRSFPVLAAVSPTAREKDFLNAQPEADAVATTTVGIGVAKEGSAMATYATHRFESPAQADKGTVVAVDLPAATSPLTAASAEKSLPMASVRETMVAVIEAVEALASRADTAQSAVKLDFQMGAEKLALHLELRAGTVHTTFRTDSAELRTALGQEWQSAVPTMTAREMNVAAPVFAPASSHTTPDASQGSLGQGHPQQRGQQTPETPHFYPGRVAATATVTDPLSPAPAAAPVVSTSLLNAFA